MKTIHKIINNDWFLCAAAGVSFVLAAVINYFIHGEIVW